MTHDSVKTEQDVKQGFFSKWWKTKRRSTSALLRLQNWNTEQLNLYISALRAFLPVPLNQQPQVHHINTRWTSQGSLWLYRLKCCLLLPPGKNIYCWSVCSFWVVAETARTLPGGTHGQKNSATFSVLWRVRHQQYILYISLGFALTFVYLSAAIAPLYISFPW